MTVGLTELPPEGMQLGGVALAGDPDRGTHATEGLSLLFTSAGVTVQGPQPQIERLLVWTGLDSATCDERTTLTDGRDAAVMRLTSGGQSIRFLLWLGEVSEGQVAFLAQALPSWLDRYGRRPESPEPTVVPSGFTADPAPAVHPPEPGPAAPEAAGDLTPVPPPPPDEPVGEVPTMTREGSAAERVPGSEAGSTTETLSGESPGPDPILAAAAVTAAPVDRPDQREGERRKKDRRAPVPLAWEPPRDPVTGELQWDSKATPAGRPRESRRSADAPASSVAPVIMAEPTKKTGKRVLWILLVVVVAALAAAAIYVALRHHNQASSTPSSADQAGTIGAPGDTATSAPSALATTTARAINLRLSDLPTGWVVFTEPPPLRPPGLGTSGQTAALATLSTCLNTSPALAAGVFAQTLAPGEGVVGASPNFVASPTSGVIMHSSTAVFATPAQADNWAVILARPNFVRCIGNYESTLVARSVPGGTATVAPVALQAPAGTRAFGFLTMASASNGQHTVVGQAFLFGGSIESEITTTTGGAPVPTVAFAQAYLALGNRLATAANAPN